MARLLNVETMIPEDHPIRAIKGILGLVLREMDGHIGSRAYALSQRARRRIEEIFGWGKTTGCFRKSLLGCSP